ncbi:endonuclease MutS2 [Kamptonema sp. UHCC 0994]|uniref:endonuclease MutS2 n=1 Tax=Kamptonema sp. UHCC 0994 TaxID=3031329 RepID=UPI0023B9E293|nr:endonuclease MutS2 [Kamptonema sp. UHCC 0994]MDF0553664.1 endonuclease MutS2 [Kamptonema sp. UHCC 0994]
MIQAETLELLEWPRLCHHLATFTATKLGAVAALHLPIPETPTETAQLLAQTQETYLLESRLARGLSFDGIQDIGDSLERVQVQGILSGEELLAIATTLAGARQLRRVIDNQPDVPVLTELVAQLRTYPELEQEIHRCIDERGHVADRATPKLGGIRDSMRQLRDRIYQVLQGILQRQANALQEQLITQRSDRFVLPVKAPQKDAIPGIVHDTSMSGATLYIEPHRVVNLNNQMRQLLRQEQVEAEAVRRALSEQVGEVKPDLERLLAIATTLDLAYAKARYSLWLEANPPRFIDFGATEALGSRDSRGGAPVPAPEQGSGREFPTLKTQNQVGVDSPQGLALRGTKPSLKTHNSPITLRQLRHPLLVWQQQHEQGLPVVPIDLIIQPQIRVVAITGPNTGGKTVTLKTLGLAALMAKAGLFVPAREPVELPWFDYILADIGDEQSLEQSLSTFSGHIRRISRILKAIGEDGEDEGDRKDEEEGKVPSQKLTVNSQQLTVNNVQSLVLLDEVGAGTDPSEGSALAIALLQYLADRALLTVATTHFGELKALKYQDDRFENASVEFDDSSLQPTYRLLWGIPGRSNALTIAKRLGLLPEIANLAATYVGGASEDVNQVIAGLEAQRRRQETKAREATQLLQQTEMLHREVSQKAATLQERERELKLGQEVAIQEAIAAAKAEVAQVIRRLQQGPASAQNAQEATLALNQIGEKHLPSRKEPAKPKPGFRPQVGDRIRIPRVGQTAEVLSGPDNNEELTVRFGMMKMTVKLAEIESLDGQKPEIAKRAEEQEKTQNSRLRAGSQSAPPQNSNLKPQNSPITVRTSQNTIDLRGMRVSEAEREIDQAFSAAMESGVLWIIHGKGTGQLRKGIHEFLESHPLVSHYEIAGTAEGGSGVTIAYLR